MKFQEFLEKAQALVDAKTCSKVWGADLSSFANLFALPYDWSDEFSKRMQKHFITTWYCTDTWVGLAVYALDGKIVAVSTQTARKSSEVIDFVSKEAQTLVFETVLSYVREEFADQVDFSDIDDRWFADDRYHDAIQEIKLE